MVRKCEPPKNPKMPYDRITFKDADEYTKWRAFVPLFYFSMESYKLSWPSTCCRWGPIIERPAPHICRQRVYLTEQTDGTEPHTLVAADLELISSPKLVDIKYYNQNYLFCDGYCPVPLVPKNKTIILPSKVKRVRELPQHLNFVATQTETPFIQIWNVEKDRTSDSNTGVSDPDLVLAGHKSSAKSALAISGKQPFVLSGGEDKCVVLWNISDQISSLTAKRPRRSKNSAVNDTCLQPQGIFQRHEKTVRDVQFDPSSEKVFCSVGDDSLLIMWDARNSRSRSVIEVKEAHSAGIRCVDWNRNFDHHILTGSADGTLRVHDMRKPTSARAEYAQLVGHTGAVRSVQWSPDQKSLFGCAAEDNMVTVWDLEKMKGLEITPSGFSYGLIFKHCGHRHNEKNEIRDFQWHPIDTNMIASVSSEAVGGGTLQVWRVASLFSRNYW